MQENFDSTQFLIFNSDEKENNIIDLLKPKCHDIGFKILINDDIRNIKKIYFNKHIESFFIELKDEVFVGEIEFWENGDPISKRTLDFISLIEFMVEIKKFFNLKIIITYFAEPNYTHDFTIRTSMAELLPNILEMSKKCYDISADNLIIEIEETFKEL